MPLDRDALSALKMDRDASVTAARRRLYPYVLGAAALLVVVVASILWFQLREQPVAVQTARARSVAPQSAGEGPVLSATGYVVARRIATASSKVTGQIKQVFIEEGMAVEEGQVIAKLDDSAARKQLALAQSQLETARKSVFETEVRLAEAQRNLVRTESLREQGLTSIAALDQAEAEVQALQARLEVSRSEVEVSERSVALNQQDLEDTLIRAPFSGIVISKNAQPGEMISPVSAGGGFTRTGIGTIVDMQSLEIEVDVNEAYINRVAAEQRVEAVLDAYPNWSIAAHVINIVPTADRQKATVKVRIAFEELDPRILPDMGVQVRFYEIEAEAESANTGAQVVVPEAAVRISGNRDFVYVLSGDTLERRAVSLAGSSRGEVFIAAGLRAGEEVVTTADGELGDGMEVRRARRED
ncbi:MAG: efflux RND transporter periplasmic adaptor subunit [Gammaproteobacteria bacterium]|nr:efflux RND transporter periplasmic adaptor subunit [Gammaproteobacteria bacterium]